jgi:hypothetical protein
MLVYVVRVEAVDERRGGNERRGEEKRLEVGDGFQ